MIRESLPYVILLALSVGPQAIKKATTLEVERFSTCKVAAG
jgi:hypothetical protein